MEKADFLVSGAVILKMWFRASRININITWELVKKMQIWEGHTLELLN